MDADERGEVWGMIKREKGREKLEELAPTDPERSEGVKEEEMSMSSELSRSKKQCMKLGWMNRKLEEQLQASRDRVDSQVI